jgi:hypothetical protein
MNIHKIKNAREGAPLTLIAEVPAELSATLVGIFRRRGVSTHPLNPTEFIAECSTLTANVILSSLALEIQIGAERVLEVPA